MNNRDIQILMGVLRHKGKAELANLLDGSSSDLLDSGQYGSNWNATLCTFVIHAPLEKFYQLKDAIEHHSADFMDALLDIYPKVAEEPEIINIEVRLSRELNFFSEPNRQVMAEKSNLEIFISYSTLDKEIAGEIKRALADAGMTAFLAHEDIRPSAEWIEVILDNLGSCDIFVPIFTDNFRQSDWTTQETNIAYAKDKLIVPVSVSGIGDNTPFGFVGKFQSLKLDPKKAYQGGVAIAETIVERGQDFSFKYRLINGLIEKLSASGTYDKAGTRADLLTKVVDMDSDQVNKLFEAITQNSQIYQSRSASSSIKTLYDRYKGKISDDNIAGLKIVKPSYFEDEIPF